MAGTIADLHCQEETSDCSSSDCCSSLQRHLGLRTLSVLGKGGQGIVFLCTNQALDVRLACKTIRSHAQSLPHSPSPPNYQLSTIQDGRSKKLKLDATINAANNLQHPQSSRKRKLSAEEVYQDAQLRWEAQVLQRLSNIPGVLPLVSTFEGDDSCFHLVTAFCDAGDLLSKLDSCAPLFKLSEHEAALIIASLAHTLAACHARGIVHRDIKPGNILFRRVQETDCEEVVLADFGLASTIAPGETLSDCVGTSQYQAPEVIQGQYDHRADIWSLGIVLHLLLTSSLPFNIEHIWQDAPDSAIRHAICHNELELQGFHLSSSAQDLLTRILCKDPHARLSLDEMLCHPWLLHNMVPVNVASKQTRNRATKDFPTELMSSSPCQYEVQQAVAGSDDSDGAPKIKRVRKPMGRKCFRQQWANAIAKAALA